MKNVVNPQKEQDFVVSESETTASHFKGIVHDVSDRHIGITVGHVIEITDQDVSMRAVAHVFKKGLQLGCPRYLAPF